MTSTRICGVAAFLLVLVGCAVAQNGTDQLETSRLTELKQRTTDFGVTGTSTAFKFNFVSVVSSLDVALSSPNICLSSLGGLRVQDRLTSSGLRCPLVLSLTSKESTACMQRLEVVSSALQARVF